MAGAHCDDAPIVAIAFPKGLKGGRDLTRRTERFTAIFGRDDEGPRVLGAVQQVSFLAAWIDDPRRIIDREYAFAAQPCGDGSGITFQILGQISLSDECPHRRPVLTASVAASDNDINVVPVAAGGLSGFRSSQQGSLLSNSERGNAIDGVTAFARSKQISFVSEVGCAAYLMRQRSE
jgi:hypothetical protein